MEAHRQKEGCQAGHFVFEVSLFKYEIIRERYRERCTRGGCYPPPISYLYAPSTPWHVCCRGGSAQAAPEGIFSVCTVSGCQQVQESRLISLRWNKKKDTLTTQKAALLGRVLKESDNGKFLFWRHAVTAAF